MGNSNGCSVPEYDVQQKTTKCYEITHGKEGFAVLVGSDLQGSNGAGLPSMDSALKKTCHVDTQAPFLSQSKINRAMPMFTKENFDRLCRLLFDKDMIQSLGLYSSLFFYFCGYGDGTGMITVDNQCIPYIEMVKRVLEHSVGTHKPTVFIFDCHLRENTSIQIKSIARDFTEQLGPALSRDTLVCMSFSNFKPSAVSDTFTSELASAIEKYSQLLSLTDLIDFAGSQVQYKSDGKFLGPLCLDYLNAQLMLVQDPTVKVYQESEQWVDYCCTQITNTFGDGHDRSTSSDLDKLGVGHSVCILYAYDSCGSHVPPNSVYALAKSLFELGFKVFCECIERTSPQRDWIRWYCISLSRCDNVIVVPSPMLSQIFSNTSVSSPYSDCVKVFTKVHQAMNNKKVLQFHLVMLTEEYDQKCVPAVFTSQKMYRLTDTASLSHTSTSGNEYRSLILCMARQPPIPTDSQTLSVSSANQGIKTSSAPVLGEQVPKLTTLEDIKAYFFRPVKQGYKVVTQVAQPTPILSTPTLLQQPTRQLPIPEQLHGSNPPLIPNPQPPPTTTHPTLVNLSKEHVSIQAMLWLSGKVIHWKFIGRKLSVDDFQLQRIEAENPRDISEQIYQMLDKWIANSTFEDANYDTLARAVEFAEGKAVKEEFIEFVVSNCLGTNHHEL